MPKAEIPVRPQSKILLDVTGKGGIFVTEAGFAPETAYCNRLFSFASRYFLRQVLFRPDSTVCHLFHWVSGPITARLPALVYNYVPRKMQS